MKESSGIYKSIVDNSIYVVFGGKIALSLCRDNEHHVLMMQELKENINVGDICDRNKINEDRPPVSLVFNDVKSVDGVIEYLEKLKENLNNNQIAS